MTDLDTLLTRYGTAAVPRYTSYPSANLWPAVSGDFASRVLQRAKREVSLYVHVPFCRSLCLYCGCNMLVTRDAALVERYLDALDREVALVAKTAAHKGDVVQLHLGGGTPTFLTPDQLRRVVRTLQRHFDWSEIVEAGIEIHPAVTTFEHIDALADVGMNRLSLGVQDFDPDVQARVRRFQTADETRGLIERARAQGFVSVNIDLMYGLPLQTVARFDRTLDEVIAMSPDRIALFGYAHVPQIKRHQRLLVVDEMPTLPERLALLRHTITRLEEAGYVHVGLDHFAKQTDELVTSRADGTLRRNFMGYTTCADSDVIAFGPSSISEIRGAYLQNERDVSKWATLVESDRFAVVRGSDPTAADRLRADVIQRLFCHLALDLAPSERRLLEPELARLAPLAVDGLVIVDERTGHVEVTKTGQLFLRNIAAVFDEHLAPAEQRMHSTAV